MKTFESYSVQIFDTISQLQKQFDDINLKHEELRQQIKKTQENSITDEELIKVKTMMDKTLEYNNKLLSLRTVMVNMSIKSKQLIQRSDKLKATKMEYLSKVDTIRKIEQERDKSIAAEIVSHHHHNDNIIRSSSSSSLSSLKTKEGIIGKNKKPSSPSISSSPLLSSSPLPNDYHTNMIENKSSPTTSIKSSTSSSTTTNINNNYNNINNNINNNYKSNDTLSRSSSSSILMPSSPNMSSTNSPIQDVSTTIAAESTPTVIAIAKKKKRKPKVREIVIDDNDNDPAWVPKKSLSSKPLK
ncbi:unnamed protein product [Cunninghamella blakesleeana]